MIIIKYWISKNRETDKDKVGTFRMPAIPSVGDVVFIGSESFTVGGSGVIWLHTNGEYYPKIFLV